MASTVGVAQTLVPPFVPGPNAVDGADPTASTWTALTGSTPAATAAQITAAQSLATSANSDAQVGKTFANDVADNDHVSGAEKRRYQNLVNGWQTSIPALVAQGNALGMTGQAATLNTNWTSFNALLTAINFNDASHSTTFSSIGSSRTAFLASEQAFSDAATALATAAQEYANSKGAVTSFNMFTDPLFNHFQVNGNSTANSDWQQILGFIAQTSTDGTRIYCPAGVGQDSIAMGPNVKCSYPDRIDGEFEYYVESSVPASAIFFGIVIQFFNQSGAYQGGLTFLVNALTAPRNSWQKFGQSQLVTAMSLSTGGAAGATAFCRAYAVCNTHTTGNVYLRNLKANKTPGTNYLLDAGTGRATTATIGSSNLVAGIKNANTGYVLSSAVSGSTATVNIGASSYTFDNGQTINYPTGSITGLAFNATYYISRVDPLLNGGTSYVATLNLTSALAPGYVYLGYITTISSGGTGGGGGGIGGGGCVGEDMWVATSKGDKRARDVEPGDLIMVLTADQASWEWAHCLSNEPAENTVVTLRGLDTGAELYLSINTTMYNDPPTRLDIAGNAWKAPLKTTTGLVIDEEPCTVTLKAMAARVQKIDLGGRIYAAGRERGRYVFSHNPTVSKQ